MAGSARWEPGTCMRVGMLPLLPPGHSSGWTGVSRRQPGPHLQLLRAMALRLLGGPGKQLELSGHQGNTSQRTVHFFSPPIFVLAFKNSYSANSF